jgi:transcription initiation factor TFIID subunit 2
MTAPKPVKPRPRKQKVPDVPPPPYVDDGSHDILQEVLAIEREKVKKKVKRDPSLDKDARRDSSTPTRKRKPEIPLDDDISTMAGPAKKERKSTESVASSSHSVERNRATDPSTSTRLTVAPSVTEAPRISFKGKEKEIVPSRPSTTPAPIAKPKKPATQSTPINEKRCKDALKAVHQIPQSAIFLAPVDPIRDGCPT